MILRVTSLSSSVVVRHMRHTPHSTNGAILSGAIVILHEERLHYFFVIHRNHTTAVEYCLRGLIIENIYQQKTFLV
jgi:hypothetical protein